MSATAQCRSSSKFLTAAVQAIVQIVKVLLGLGDQAVEPLNRLALNLAVEQIAELHLLAVDEGVEADVNVIGHPLDFLKAVGGGLFQPRLKRPLVKNLLDGLAVRDAMAICRRGRARRRRDDFVQHGRLADGHLPGGIRLYSEEPAVQRIAPAVLD